MTFRLPSAVVTRAIGVVKCNCIDAIAHRSPTLAGWDALQKSRRAIGVNNSATQDEWSFSLS
jgi:hypothetical protein